MPLRQARSGRRGRPPLGFAFGGVKRGSIKSHKSSGSMAVRIAVHLHPVLLFEPGLVARRGVDAHETSPPNGVAAAIAGQLSPRRIAWLGHYEHSYWSRPRN